MQAEGKLPPGTARKYGSAFGAYATIAREEGFLGLWKGVGPNIGRNALINAAELASYDQVKQTLLGTGLFGDTTGTHVLAGLGAGFVAVCVGSPVDVVKSRVMGDKAGQYSGMADCFVKTYAKEGFGAFYKGFLPNFARLGAWNVTMFLALEQAREEGWELGGEGGDICVCGLWTLARRPSDDHTPVQIRAAYRAHTAAH